MYKHTIAVRFNNTDNGKGHYEGFAGVGFTEESAKQEARKKLDEKIRILETVGIQGTDYNVLKKKEYYKLPSDIKSLLIKDFCI